MQHSTAADHDRELWHSNLILPPHLAKASSPHILQQFFDVGIDGLLRCAKGWEPAMHPCLLAPKLVSSACPCPLSSPSAAPLLYNCVFIMCIGYVCNNLLGCTGLHKACMHQPPEINTLLLRTFHSSSSPEKTLALTHFYLGDSSAVASSVSKAVASGDSQAFASSLAEVRCVLAILIR